MYLCEASTLGGKSNTVPLGSKHPFISPNANKAYSSITLNSCQNPSNLINPSDTHWWPPSPILPMGGLPVWRLISVKWSFSSPFSCFAQILRKRISKSAEYCGIWNRTLLVRLSQTFARMCCRLNREKKCLKRFSKNGYTKWRRKITQHNMMQKATWN